MIRPRRSAFTLLELLITISIILVLTALLAPSLRAVILRAERASVKAELETLEIALTSYLGDHRRFPRNAGYATPDDLLRDDAPALWAGLMNGRTAALGGGSNAPYLDSWDNVGVMIDTSKLDADTMGKDGVGGARRLDEDERSLAQTVAYQTLHGPKSAEPLVLLDRWGNPLHYREWAGVRVASKQALVQTPVPRSGFSAGPNTTDEPIAGPVGDRPHAISGIEIWSSGPNGVNEYGKGDDVATWHTR